MTFEKYFQIILRGKYLIGGSILVCVLIARSLDMSTTAQWEARAKFDPLIRSISAGYYDLYLTTSETVIKINSDFDLSSVVDKQKKSEARFILNKRLLVVSGGNNHSVNRRIKQIGDKIVKEATDNAVFDMKTWLDFIDENKRPYPVDLLIKRQMHADKFFEELARSGSIVRVHYSVAERIEKRFKLSSDIVLLIGFVAGGFLGLLLALIKDEFADGEKIKQ